MTHPTTNKLTSYEDPDPFTIAFGLVGVISLTIQLVDKAKSARASSNVIVRGQRFELLTQLQTNARDTSAALDTLIRVVEQGSSDPESQLFDAPFRMAKTQLWLDEEAQGAFQRTLAEFQAKLSNLSLWINHILFQNPDLAIELGQKLERHLTGLPDEMNNLMAQGGPIREAVRGARTVLSQLLDVTNEALSRRN